MSFLSSVSCDGNEECVLDCCGENIQIKNIVLEQEGCDSAGIVSVKKGKAVFHECEMKCSTVGVTVERGAELVMEKCKVHGARVCSFVTVL